MSYLWLLPNEVWLPALDAVPRPMGTSKVRWEELEKAKRLKKTS